MKRLIYAAVLFAGLSFGQGSRADREWEVGPITATGATAELEMRDQGCIAYIIVAETYGSSPVISATIQQAPRNSDGSGPGTWATYAGTVIGSNPITTTLASVRLIGGAPYMRFNITSLTGTFRASVRCYRAAYNVASYYGGPVNPGYVAAGDSTTTTPLDIFGTTSGAWARFYQAGVLKGYVGAFTGGTAVGFLNHLGNSLWSCNITTLACVFAGRNQSVTLKEAVNTVTFSATPVFDMSLGNPFITLTNNVTSSTVSNLTSGQRMTFTICQDAVGSRTFAWPTAVKGATTIGSTASRCNVQEFWSPDGSNIYAISAGVINQ